VPTGCQFQSRSGPHCHIPDTPDKAEVAATAEEAFEELAAPVPRRARLKFWRAAWPRPSEEQGRWQYRSRRRSTDSDQHIATGRHDTIRAGRGEWKGNSGYDAHH